MKKILGLDLGTTSIGWALVNQAENGSERSSITKVGVRVNPLTADEKDSFEKGRSITTNADRTLKRSARRNLQRYILRRENLVGILKEQGWITDESVLSESGPGSTYETFRLRALAPKQEISLAELSRVLLMLNKKRGYKSNRKADSSEEGHLFDGLEVARKLYQNELTPAQYCLKCLSDGQRFPSEFYRSDLQAEYDRIWSKQSEYYPEILTEDFHNQISNQGKAGVTKIFLAKYGIFTADNKGKEKKVVALKWRSAALEAQLSVDQMAYVIADIKGELQNTSGYLGAISDRSKKLYFDKRTVGEYLYENILNNRNYSTKNEVFYRQDYLDEFEAIWECQKRFHPEMTDALKKEIRDVVIFYQRNLKSQKGLISFCEFERREIYVEVDGKVKTKIRGCRVAPRSSLLFQEFKIWSVLNNLIVTDKTTMETCLLSEEDKLALSKELQIHSKMKSSEVLSFLGLRKGRYSLNYESVEGNTTLSALYAKFVEIIGATGHDEYDISKMHYDDLFPIIRTVFSGLGFNTDILFFDSSLEKEKYEQQPLFKLWHLLYSYEGDKSRTGNESLINKISDLCSMPKEYAAIVAQVKFVEDYASLSHKAIKKILPYLKGGNTYDKACLYAGYNHSSSITKEEIENKQLLDKLTPLAKGSLRNPVVEKILNQMINVVNEIAASYGKPDEIHIEYARELKQNAKQREEATKAIAERTKQNGTIVKILQEEFGLSYVSRTDILRYRLYEELKENGYKTLYSDKYIPRDKLFSREIDIEHIIPQARLFDDSFSNKTLEYRDINQDKGNDTALDFVSRRYGEDGIVRFKLRVDDLMKRGAISRAKCNKLLMKQEDIPSDFINRDLTNSQYIAKKAKELLEEFVKVVMPTTGEVTAKLREDWQLVDVMKELNLPKYRSAGQIYSVERPDGNVVDKISDWSKRNDHRHHTMDAITIAFTRPSHIQILNNLNACSNKSPEFVALRNKETSLVGTKRIFNPPIPMSEMRREVLNALDSVLVSIKAKNKVVTKNTNKIKTAEGEKKTICLTPRGQLHKEQVYGKRSRYEVFEVAVGGGMDENTILSVAKKEEREALMKRLHQFDGDPKKAFAGKNAPSKNPVWINKAMGLAVPAKVKCVRLSTLFSIRKEVTPDLSLEKVADSRIRHILEERVAEFGGDKRKAFSNLDENPIWVNKEKGIALKRVAILENFDLCAIRNKKDKEGKDILTEGGTFIPNDYVNLKNNHHVAIYEDENGEYQELVVSFFEALERISNGLPAVNYEYKKKDGWKFVFSMKTNEMFVFPNGKTEFDPTEIDLTNPANNNLISPNLYRVQRISSKDYYFRHHLETQIEDNSALINITWKRIRNPRVLKGVVKVRVDNLGRIVSVGEYD